jgi:SAM-dependent methyltransferase
MTIRGWLNLDRSDLPNIDVSADLDLCREVPLPLADGTIDDFLLSHVIEHIRDPLAMMQELHRVAKPDACMMVRVPYGSSDDAWEDQTHVRGYFLNSFNYFGQPHYFRADYGYRGDWATEHIYLFVRGCEGLDAKAAMEKVRTERNVVAEMVVRLSAVKPIRETRQELMVRPRVTIQSVV